MIKSEITATFKSDIGSVWNVVTNNKDGKWRSDIERIEESDDGMTFIEYAPNGEKTKFTITKKIPYSAYEFDMEHKIFTGFFAGHFTETEGGGTKAVFTENILLKNPFFKILSSVFAKKLMKMQETYVENLKNKLVENLKTRLGE